MRTLGIDYGRKRLGLALSDENGILASPLSVYQRRGLEQDLSSLDRLVKENGAGNIIIGLPLNMDGSKGKMAMEVLSFSDRLSKRLELPVSTFDERYTSLEAERVLQEASLSRKKRKIARDSLAAVLILQGWLDKNNE
ncbi:MAG: Holliday junction resolvase RuvX [Candidatus Bipolaricaulota bacterium]|nr:Holliday junction resolvase RuvX [Candidatus Bipolaricaulota bacterium]